MVLSVFHTSTETPNAIPLDSIFGQLCKWTHEQVVTLNIFKEVGLMFRPKQTPRTPTLMVIPTKTYRVEEGTTQATEDMRYEVELNIVLKNPRDNEILLTIMSAAQLIRNHFLTSNGGNVIVDPSTVGHYHTTIEESQIEPKSFSDDNVLVANLGVNLVYHVYKPRV